jgi:prepilin-type N-terminal cleavage/methylation domain-containing protein
MRAQRGMTLLEVLVALMVLALTGMLFSEGMRFGTAVWERAGVTADAAMTRFDAARTLRRLIEQAEPGISTDKSGPFEGDGLTLSFRSFDAARLSGGRGRRIELTASAKGEAVVLQITDPEGIDKDETLVLFDHASVTGIRYFGHKDTGNGDAWTDRWTDGIDLPRLVEVSLAFSDGAPPMLLRAAPRKRYSVECMVFGRRVCSGSTR